MNARVLSLARAELLLLRRNKVAMFSVVAVPLVGAFVLAGVSADGAAAAGGIGILIGFLLLFVVYYNLLAAYVARREELVLKRLRTGECTDIEVLAGTAAPAWGIALAQLVLLVVVGAVLLDLPMPVNLPLLLVAVLLGVLVFTGLALVTAPWTRSSEAAQITSLPVVSLCVLGAGLAVPLELLPDPVAAVGAFLPLSPVVELVQLAWLGSAGGVGSAGGGAPLDLLGTTTAAAGPLMIAVAWVVVGLVGAKLWFRWEPRG